jgi:hypothetical protein
LLYTEIPNFRLIKRCIIIIIIINTNINSVIIWANRTISKSLRQYLSNIPGKHEIKELQKTATFGIAHTLWKVLMKQHKTYFTGEKNINVADIVTTEQLQKCIP